MLGNGNFYPRIGPNPVLRVLTTVQETVPKVKWQLPRLRTEVVAICTLHVPAQYHTGVGPVPVVMSAFFGCTSTDIPRTWLPQCQYRHKSYLLSVRYHAGRKKRNNSAFSACVALHRYAYGRIISTWAKVISQKQKGDHYRTSFPTIFFML